jgi:hypothetical protein
MKKGGGGDNRRGGGKRNRNEKPIAENEEQNKKAQAQSAEGDEGSNDHSGGRAKQKKGGKKKGRNMLKFEARQNRAAQLHTTTSLAEGGSGVTMDIDGHPHLLIDGAYKEGGGQVLRNTFSLSALLGRPIKAFNIRANRNRPGLMAQHLTGIRLVAEMFDGWLDGAEVRFFFVNIYFFIFNVIINIIIQMKMAPQLWSREVAFRPGRFVADRKQFTGDTGTAGYSLHLHLLPSSSSSSLSLSCSGAHRSLRNCERGTCAAQQRSATLLIQISLPCLVFAPRETRTLPRTRAVHPPCPHHHQTD